MIYDPHELTEGQIIEVIEDAGFEADIIRQSSERQQPSLQVCRDPACHFWRAIFRWTRSRKIFQMYALYPKIKHFLPTNITKTDECARSPTFHTDTPEFQQIDTASLLPTELEYLRPMASTGRSFSRNPESVSKLNKPKGRRGLPIYKTVAPRFRWQGLPSWVCTARHARMPSKRRYKIHLGSELLWYHSPWSKLKWSMTTHKPAS